MSTQHTGRGRKRRIDHEAIVAYARANPAAHQADVAALFGTSQSRVSQILRSAGERGVQRGRPITRKAGQSDEEFHWEQVLHEHGLGMDRGLRINKHRVLYGYDPALAHRGDRSATVNAAS